MAFARVNIFHQSLDHQKVAIVVQRRKLKYQVCNYELKILELWSVEHLLLSEYGGEKPELITADPIQKQFNVAIDEYLLISLSGFIKDHLKTCLHIVHQFLKFEINF